MVCVICPDHHADLAKFIVFTGHIQRASMAHLRYDLLLPIIGWVGGGTDLVETTANGSVVSLARGSWLSAGVATGLRQQRKIAPNRRVVLQPLALVVGARESPEQDVISHPRGEILHCGTRLALK
eukprot:8833591-Pyramimonas_sp.AAC.3